MSKSNIKDKIAYNQTVMTQQMRCPGCGRFIGLQAIVLGRYKTKCPNSNCKEWITIDVFSQEKTRKRLMPYQEVHCNICGRFIGFQAIIWGTIKQKCQNSHCKEWLTIDIKPKHKI